MEDLPLGDILQLINLSGRTGILRIENSGGQSLLAFKDGAIVFASSDLLNVNLPKMLLEMGKLSKRQLDEIFEYLKHQKDSSFAAELIRKGLLNADIIDEIAKKYFQAVIQCLISYEEGKFSFSLEDTISLEKINFKTTDIFMEEGIDPQYLLLDGAKTSDELKREISDSTQKAFKEFIRQHSVKEEEVFLFPGKVFKQEWKEDFWQPSEPSPPKPEKLEDSNNFKIRLAAAASIEKNIILIDDESLAREQISKHLRNYGFKVYSCLDAEEALKQYRKLSQQGKNFVMVSDLIMPSFYPNSLLGGLDLLEKVHKEKPDIPVILMTEYTHAKVRQRAYLMGALNYLFKPQYTKIDIDNIEEIYSQFVQELICVVLPIFENLAMGGRGIKQGEPSQLVPYGGALKKREEKALRKQISILKEMTEELQHPESSSQISLLALRLASEVLERAFLFLVKSDEYAGVGGFGLSSRIPITERLRNIKIPLWEDCIFDYVLETKHTFKGKIPQSNWNRYLIEKLENVEPREVVIIPIISKGRVIALLYGDNRHKDEPIESIEGIEIFMSQVGIAFENAVLERKLLSLISK